jgi:hypothetical protein
MTQMIGAQDSASESGAAGEGASGNPDGPFGGNATFMYGPPRGFWKDGQWHSFIGEPLLGSREK